MRLSVEHKHIKSREVADYFAARAQHSVVYSSVNEPALRRLVAFTKTRVRLQNARDLVMNSTRSFTSIKSTGTGTDRLIGAVAAMHMMSTPVLSIDCGTATTFNLVNKHGEFEGGLILPGLETQLESLNKGTDKLPKIELKELGKGLIGRSPREAIANGVKQGMIGAIRHIIDAIRAKRGYEDLHIVCTGGNALAVLPELRKLYAIKQVDDLVLRGIFELVRG